MAPEVAISTKINFAFNYMYNTKCITFSSNSLQFLFVYLSSWCHYDCTYICNSSSKLYDESKSTCTDPEGGGGAWGPDPLENYKKNIGFLSNTGPHLLKITKLPSQHSMLGHNRPTSETPFKWRFAGGPLMIR